MLNVLTKAVLDEILESIGLEHVDGHESESGEDG